jgi:D-xylose transport system ATP-binding protein
VNTVEDAPESVPLLRIQGARKSYGHVQALRSANLEVHAGEVVALMGDNGAGKSTLLKVIAGAHSADSGELTMAGAAYAPHSPQEARALGIETVYQGLGLLNNLDVTANLFLGRELHAHLLGLNVPVLRRREMRRNASEVLERYSMRGITPGRAVSDLSGGQRQMLSIARAAESGARLVLMDEPTAALGIQESQRVLDLITALAGRGVAVILVSHNMEHVYSVASRAVVLRRGETVGNFPTASTSQNEVVHAIVGADYSPSAQAH